MTNVAPLHWLVPAVLRLITAYSDGGANAKLKELNNPDAVRPSRPQGSE